MTGEWLDPNGVKVLYHFNGNNNDSGPNGWNLTTTGTVTNVSGKFNQANLFGSGYLDNSSFTEFGATDEFSLLAWIYPTSISSAGYVFSHQDGSTRSFQFSLETTGKLFFSNGVAGADTNGNNTLSLNQWYLICATRESANSGTNSIYINGDLDVRQTSCGNNGNIAGTNFTIGDNSQGHTSKFSGMIDEVAVFTRPLSAKEIKDYYSWAVGRFTKIL